MRERARTYRAQILGVGSPVLCDDAAGIAVVERLQAEGLPAGVAATVGGAGGLALLDLIEDCDCLIVVDAAITGSSPGTLHEFGPGDLESGPTLHLAPTHGFDLAVVLQLLEVQGRNPPRTIRILGIEAADVQTLSESCTPPVEKAAARAAALIRSSLGE
ncbi:MAG: hydrogenase maturation protease [Desulfohalobiaceae bacterium]|nr:hydrogenase maturation protease [Desulfohalobiaceae bacterium]